MAAPSDPPPHPARKGASRWVLAALLAAACGGGDSMPDASTESCASAVECDDGLRGRGSVATARPPERRHRLPLLPILIVGQGAVTCSSRSNERSVDVVECCFTIAEIRLVPTRKAAGGTATTAVELSGVDSIT